MKHNALFAILTLGISLCVVTLFSCQKENVQQDLPGFNGAQTGADRSPNHITYGATLFGAGSPSQLVAMDLGTGNVVAGYPIGFSTIDPNGAVVVLDNVKGICLGPNGRYYITTGSPASSPLGVSVYDNSLFSLNPATGVCALVSTSPFNTVSDLEYDPVSGNFYGLANNSNSIIGIVGGVYVAPAAITGIANGYTLKGLSVVSDVNGVYLVGCATSNNSHQQALLYRIPAAGGAATLLTALNPVADLGGGHCGIGFDIDINTMVVNRNTNPFSFALGLNSFAWAPFGAATPTAFWGGAGYNFEDLTSYIR